MYENGIKVLHLELSNKCNSHCPACSRYTHGKLNPLLDLTSWSLDFFKKVVPSDFIKNLDSIYFAGGFGDPITCKDLIPILQYVYEQNPEIFLQIHTNGGIRDKVFWSSLAQVLNTKKRRCTFAIDGLQDTHSIYRRGVSFDKVIDNASTFIELGGVALWDYLVFEHNEHQIEEARSLSRKLGFKEFNLKKPLGFKKTYKYPMGVMSVYSQSQEKIGQIFPSNLAEFRHKNSKKRVDVTLLKSEDIFFGAAALRARQSLYDLLGADDVEVTLRRDISEDNKKEACKIACKAKGQKSLYISASGFVFPCCFIGNDIQRAFPHFNARQVQAIYKKMSVERFNLHSKNIHDIIKDPFFNEVSTGKWYDAHGQGRLLATCSSDCGKKSQVDEIYLDRRVSLNTKYRI